MTGAFRKVGWIVLILAVLAQTGCATIAILGAAAGAGAAGYAYYNGLLFRDYTANLGDTISAVRTSLTELQFPILEEKPDTGSAYFRTKTGDGHTVRVYLDTVPSSIPIEGAVTRVSIRVGFSGDEPVSARILDQVSRHLVSPAAIPPTSAATPSAVLGAPRPPAETPPPPLAPPIRPTKSGR